MFAGAIRRWRGCVVQRVDVCTLCLLVLNVELGPTSVSKQPTKRTTTTERI